MFNKIFISIMFLLAFTAPAFSTISSTTSRMTYTGNGAVDTYSYTFKIFSSSDLLVTVRDTDDVETTLTLTTDYTVTGVGRTAGGTVVLVNSAQSWLDADGDLKTGYTLSIRRVKQLKQLTDIRNQGAFYPEVHEDTFDGLVMIDQQQQDEIDRSMKLSETTDPADFSTELPASLVNNPGVTIIVNDAGDGFEVGPTADDISAAEANATTASAAAVTASAAAVSAAASAATISLPSITGNSLNFLQANSGASAIQYTDLRSPNIGIGTVTPNAGKFTTLVTTGNVGIGSNTPGTALDVVGTVRATSFTGSGSVPTGAILQWATGSAPTGWLLCDGTAVSRATYSALFSTIGTTFGSGDGSTTFNLPDFKGRNAIGYKSSDTLFDALGETGGETLHTMTLAELVAHTHSYSTLTTPGAGNSGGAYDTVTSGTTGSTGSTTPFNVLDPYLTVNYIIKF